MASREGPWRIGVDLDNTLVCYDDVFGRAARERGLLPSNAPATKLAVRDLLRADGREDAWTELQGHVYGTRMDDAAIFPGAVDVLCAMRAQGDEVFIVSHRTRRPALGPPHDLHRAARDWVARHLHHDGRPVVDESHVFLETTREEKLRRIGDLGCDAFVEDLPQVLLAPSFPPTTRRILFDPDGRHSAYPGLERVRAWAELRRVLAKRP